jgi:hypothetical protein
MFMIHTSLRAVTESTYLRIPESNDLTKGSHKTQAEMLATRSSHVHHQDHRESHQQRHQRRHRRDGRQVLHQRVRRRPARCVDADRHPGLRLKPSSPKTSHNSSLGSQHEPESDQCSGGSPRACRCRTESVQNRERDRLRCQAHRRGTAPRRLAQREATQNLA